MNSCPCGKPRKKGCLCSETMINNYWRKLSGPIRDRIDIWVHIDAVEYEKLAPGRGGRDNRWQSGEMARRVQIAREVQLKRFRSIGRSIYFNSEMNASDIEKVICIDEAARLALETSVRKLELSGRAFHRIIKVARTIADLDGVETITKKQIYEALQFRKR